MTSRLSLIAIVVAVGSVAPSRTAPLPDARDEIRVTITPPQGGPNGRIVITLRKAKLLEEVRKAIPDSVALPDQKLGDKLIYRDVQLNHLTAVDLKPSSLTFDAGTFGFAGTPVVKGDLNALYEHVVITTEVKTVAKVGGIEVKQSVPVKKSDWRPKGAAPFTIKLDVQGTCKVSFKGDGLLKDQQLHLDTRADYVRISGVELKSDDPLYKIVKEVIGVVGKAFPNEGLNKPIKEGLTRSFDIDLFKNLSQKDRAQLGPFGAKNATISSTDTDVRVSGDLVTR